MYDFLFYSFLELFYFLRFLELYLVVNKFGKWVEKKNVHFNDVYLKKNWLQSCWLTQSIMWVVTNAEVCIRS